MMSETILSSNALLNQRYELVGVIGTGQYGTAWKARSRANGQIVCLKRIPLNSKDDHKGALQEAQLLSRLEHPNIISYVDSFLDSEGALCIVTTYCEDGDLYSRIRSRKAEGRYFTEAEVMDTFIQIASALLYIHSQRILHRDLKSQNIFLRSNGIVMLGDFGICKVLEKTDAFATTVTGTPYYMAPEVCTNQPYTYKSDIWSLGCVLYELCTLTHAFAADSLLSLVYQIVRGSYPPVPGELFTSGMIDLVGQLLTREAAERPSLQQVLASAYVREHIQRFNSDEKRRIMRKQSSLSRRPGVTVIASSGTAEPCEMTGSPQLTPKQRVALRREEQRRKRELELQVASLTTSKDRQEVARRKQTQLASNSLAGILPVPTQACAGSPTTAAATALLAAGSDQATYTFASSINQQAINRPASPGSMCKHDSSADSIGDSNCSSFGRPSSPGSKSPRSRLAAGNNCQQPCQALDEKTVCSSGTSTRPKTAYEQYEERPVGTPSGKKAQTGAPCHGEEDDDYVNLATMPGYEQPVLSDHGQDVGETSMDSDSVLLGSVVHQQQPLAPQLLGVSWNSTDMQQVCEQAKLMQSVPVGRQKQSPASADVTAACMPAAQRAVSAPGTTGVMRFGVSQQPGAAPHPNHNYYMQPSSSKAPETSCVGKDGVVRFGARSNGQATSAFDFVLQRAASGDVCDASASSVQQTQHTAVQQVEQHAAKAVHVTAPDAAAAAAAGSLHCSAGRYVDTSSDDYEADFEEYEQDFDEIEGEDDEQLLAEVEQRKRIRETIAQLSKSFTSQVISAPSSPSAQPSALPKHNAATKTISSQIIPAGTGQQPHDQQKAPTTISACQAALGSQFGAVHDYLLQVHKGAANGCASVRGEEVKHYILLLVGADRTKQEACFSLEQLVFRAVLAGQ